MSWRRNVARRATTLRHMMVAKLMLQSSGCDGSSRATCAVAPRYFSGDNCCGRATATEAQLVHPTGGQAYFCHRHCPVTCKALITPGACSCTSRAAPRQGPTGHCSEQNDALNHCHRVFRVELTPEEAPNGRLLTHGRRICPSDSPAADRLSACVRSAGRPERLACVNQGSRT